MLLVGAPRRLCGAHGYTCLALSVASMAILMWVNDDPDASLPLTAGFVGFALLLVILTGRLYRNLVTGAPAGTPASMAAET